METAILKTNNFKRSTLWVKRTVISILISFVIFLLCESYEVHSVWQLIMIFFALILVIIIPIDDLEVNEKYLICIKRSVVPILSVYRKYEIAKINSVTCSGNYSKGYEIFELISLANFYQSVNRLVINMDTSTIAINVAIYKIELSSIVDEVNKLITMKQKKKK